MIRPLEHVLLQVKCYSNKEEKEGILVITNARAIFKLDNTFAFQLLRRNLKVQKAYDEKKLYWVLQMS